MSLISFLDFSCFLNLNSVFFCSRNCCFLFLLPVVLDRMIPWAKTCSSFSLEMFMFLIFSFFNLEMLSFFLRPVGESRLPAELVLSVSIPTLLSCASKISIWELNLVLRVLSLPFTETFDESYL